MVPRFLCCLTTSVLMFSSDRFRWVAANGANESGKYQTDEKRSPTCAGLLVRCKDKYWSQVRLQRSRSQAHASPSFGFGSHGPTAGMFYLWLRQGVCIMYITPCLTFLLAPKPKKISTRNFLYLVQIRFELLQRSLRKSIQELLRKWRCSSLLGRAIHLVVAVAASFSGLNFRREDLNRLYSRLRTRPFYPGRPSENP